MSSALPASRWRRMFPGGFWAWFSALPLPVQMIYAVTYAAAWFLLAWWVLIPLVPYDAMLALMLALAVWAVLDARYRRFRLLRLEASLQSTQTRVAKAVVELMNRPRAEQWSMYRRACEHLGLPDPGPYNPEAM